MKTRMMYSGPSALLALGMMLVLFAQPLLAGTTPLSTVRVAFGLQRPIFATSPPGDYERLFIAEQPGRIKILNITTGQLLGTPFLNIDPLVLGGSSGGDEQGFLGMAFHPDYLTNGYFYVNYTATPSGNSVIARYQVSATNPNLADPSSATIVMTVTQPTWNHNAGMLAFGPLDGYLYVAFGDGGFGNDPGNRAQNTGQRLGKMLRIDVDGGTPFVIPPDNPFVGPGNPLDEIWAIGLRNPWRWSFDRETGDLWIGDVGQNAREELDFQPGTSTGGENYGWRCMEGIACTGLSGCTCNSPALTDPIHDYAQSAGGLSIIGGYAYRGCAMPDMHGIYFFADYYSNIIWSMRYNGVSISEFTVRTAELNPPGPASISSIASFGEDAYGEIYICDHLGGEIFKIVPAAMAAIDCDGNNIVDACEIAVGAIDDCNGNGVSDACDTLNGTSEDCDGNLVPDDCELASGAALDCNSNGVIDSCDVVAGTSADCNGNLVPDDCELASGAVEDCNSNGIPDECDIADLTSMDCNTNGIPDECELASGSAEDCNANGFLDECDIAFGIAEDCNSNGVVDECEIDAGTAEDCNGNGSIDACDIASGSSNDSDQNGIPDECEQVSFVRGDCNADGGFDISDPVALLTDLFGGGGGTPLTCQKACDANDDGGLDVADPVYMLSAQFTSGPLPPAPHPGCGTDPTSDSLTCDSFAACP